MGAADHFIVRHRLLKVARQRVGTSRSRAVKGNRDDVVRRTIGFR